MQTEYKILFNAIGGETKLYGYRKCTNIWEIKINSNNNHENHPQYLMVSLTLHVCKVSLCAILFSFACEKKEIWHIHVLMMMIISYSWFFFSSSCCKCVRVGKRIKVCILLLLFKIVSIVNTFLKVKHRNMCCFATSAYTIYMYNATEICVTCHLFEYESVTTQTVILWFFC